MDQKIVLLVLALVGSVQADCLTVPDCDTCLSGPCTKCLDEFYVKDGLCEPCNFTTCDERMYWDPLRCGSGNLQGAEGNGCEVCTDCVSSDGPRFKAWGICNGESGLENPSAACLTPGPALCRLCSEYVAHWATNDYDIPWDDCTGDENKDWVFLAGKDESDLEAACLAAAAEELDEEFVGDFTYCYWEYPEVDFPVAARKSCLYNMVIDAMDIYETGVGWPLPTDYPADPFNVTSFP